MFTPSSTVKIDTHNAFLPNEVIIKILASLTHHVYMQTNIALLASLFCACIFFVGLFSFAGNNSALYSWLGFFILITLSRALLVYIYKCQENPDQRIYLWRNLYIVGSLLGGLSWGLAGFIFLPHVNAAQQTLLFLMLAGATSSIVTLASAIPGATIGFLTLSIFPFIISVAMLRHNIYLLFDIALFLYYIYSIALSINSYHLIKNAIVLKFNNDTLLADLEISNKMLHQAATHDPLTKVANRRLFHESIKHAMIRADLSHKILAIYYFDLDQFKSINDNYGHRAGDHILLVATERIKNFFGTNGNIARLGGDEFAILMENVESLEDVEIIANKICQLIAIPIKMNNLDLNITTSIGISIYPVDGHDEETLLRCADRNMYYVKNQGGNGFYLQKELAHADQ